MKHLAAILLTFCLFFNKISAQILAPDITLTSINGQSYNLYDKLESGKIIIFAFFSTQSPASLTYHNSNSLNYLYNSHGPNGDNKIEIFYVEGDPATDQSCLFGNCPGSNTLNWTSGISFPIINNHLTAQLFGVSTFPSIFIVCPDKRMTAVPALSSNLLWERAQSCPVAFGIHNIGIFDFTPGTQYQDVCGALNIDPKFKVVNLGDATLTKAKTKIIWNNDIIEEKNWEGFLQKYEHYEVNAGSISVTNMGELKVSVEIEGAIDQETSNNAVITTFHDAQVFEDDTLVLKIRTDDFSHETYWEFRDENENMLQNGGNLYVGPNGGGVIISSNLQSPGTYAKNTTINKNLIVPHNGCYSLHVVDAFGDGLSCSNCGTSGGIGYYRIYNKKNQNTPIISGSNFTSYSRHFFQVYAPELVGTQENLGVSACKIFPNPASDAIHISLSSDRSQNFQGGIFNTFGTLIQQIPYKLVDAGENTWTITTQNWPAGSYTLQLIGENGAITRNFILHR